MTMTKNIVLAKLHMNNKTNIIITKYTIITKHC